MRRREVDREKLRQKIHFIRDAVRRLERIRSRGRTAFLSESVLQDAAVRLLQIGIEAMIDTGHHIIAREGLGLPRTYQETMSLLIREGILPSDKTETLSRMVKFRNRAVHLYDEIDPVEIHAILEAHLVDFDEFIQAIVRRYFDPGESEDDG